MILLANAQASLVGSRLCSAKTVTVIPLQANEGKKGTGWDCGPAPAKNNAVA